MVKPSEPYGRRMMRLFCPACQATFLRPGRDAITKTTSTADGGEEEGEDCTGCHPSAITTTAPEKNIVDVTPSPPPPVAAAEKVEYVTSPHVIRRRYYYHDTSPPPVAEEEEEGGK